MHKILVIDDSLAALQMVETMLVEAGHEVTACLESRDVLRLLENETFDLIVTDIYMPDHDGLEIIREARWICPQVPIVALSGLTGSRDLLPIAKHLGACQTLQKPFDKNTLLNIVDTALGQCVPACNASVDGPKRWA